MNISKAVAILGLFLTPVQGCASDPGQTHFDHPSGYPNVAATANGDRGQLFEVPDSENDMISKESEAETMSDLSSVKPFAASDAMRQLRSLSHHLRGGGDQAVLVEKVHDIIQTQLNSVQSLQKMYQDGNEKGLADNVKSVIKDVTALVEANKDAQENGSPIFTPSEVALYANSTLEEVADSQIMKFFEPQLFDDIAVQMENVVTTLKDVKSILQLSTSSKRLLKANLFSDESNDGNGPFEFEHNPFGFGPNGKSQEGQYSADGSSSQHFYGNQYAQKVFQKLKEKSSVLLSHRSKFVLPDIGKFLHTGDDADSVNRRLKVNDRHIRRVQAIDVCANKECTTTNDVTCNCNRLRDCINDMSDYDIALLFVGKYVDTDSSSSSFATLTDNGLNLFDADFKIVQKIQRIRELVSKNECTNLLPELHSACNPFEESCSGRNRNSFQLSIDDVCDAVHISTKLLFSSISDELDGYWGDDGRETSTTSCGNSRLAFSSCLEFATAFDLLYEGRDKEQYPDWNPMRINPVVPIASTKFILFPTNYHFKRSVHGMEELALMYDKIHPYLNTSNCMEAPNIQNRVKTATCVSGSRNQDFYFNATSSQIVLRRNGFCLNYNWKDFTVYMRACNTDSNQKWFYDKLTQELRSFWDGKCLDWGSSGPYMNNCIGLISQKFIMPSRWLPAVTLNRVRMFADPSKCMNVDSDKKLRMVSCDFKAISQFFEYNETTRQVTQEGLCIDHSRSSPYHVYMGTCHNGNNQKWYLDTSTNRLRSADGSMCVDWNGKNIYMTKCDQRLTEKYLLPEPWLEGISKSSHDEVRSFADLNICMTLLNDDSRVIMSNCEEANTNQRLYYSDESLQIVLRQSKKCLDYDFSLNTVFFHNCHKGHNQMWYHSPSTNYLRSLHDSKCMSLIGGKLVMKDCNVEDNQKFLIPSSWSGISLNTVRSMSDHTLCMVYDPDQSNNVYMNKCNSDGGLIAYIDFDFLTYEVKIGGLCLHSTFSGGNVIMKICDGSANQQWFYNTATNEIYPIHLSFKECLSMESDRNLYAANCKLTRNQKFLVPESWIINSEASDTWESKMANSKSDYPYYHQPVTPSIFSGNTCHVDWLKDTIKTCDESMNLLLGSSISLGTLQKLAKLVNDKGPTRMPGVCCLDSPLTSSIFGYHYNPASMKCQNPGPWHLGISTEACENANGRWFRTPCVTLKECIDARPKNGTTQYSQSFEDFAKPLVIKDATDEDRCMEVRDELGFESDYPFDIEVCQKFESYMCDKFFTDVDEAVDNLGEIPKFQPLTYEEVDYPDDRPLSYDMLPKRSEGSVYQAFQVPKLGTQASLGSLQTAVLVSQHAKFVVNSAWEYMNNLPVCFIATFPFSKLCWILRHVSMIVLYVVKFGLDLAFDLVSSVYEKLTLGPSEVFDNAVRVEALFDNIKTFDSWCTVALETINKNIVTQHTEMRKNLQDRHTSMESVLKTWTQDVVDNLSIYTKGLGEVLKGHHQLLLDKLTSMEDRLDDLTQGTNTGLNRSVVLLNSIHDKKAPKISCGFDLSLASSMMMMLDPQDNTTLFVKEDTSASAVPIPLVLSVEENFATDLVVDVTVRSNSALVGDRKTVALLFQSSAHKLVPYVLPSTCWSLNFEVCDQSGEDFVLYEFSVVAFDETDQSNDPVLCNVIVHSSSAMPVIRSSVRYDFLPTARFPLSFVQPR